MRLAAIRALLVSIVAWDFRIQANSGERKTERACYIRKWMARPPARAKMRVASMSFYVYQWRVRLTTARVLQTNPTSRMRTMKPGGGDSTNGQAWAASEATSGFGSIVNGAPRSWSRTASAGPCVRKQSPPSPRLQKNFDSSFNHISSILFFHYTQFIPANMGFTDLVSEAGLTLLNSFVRTRSYIVG